MINSIMTFINLIKLYNFEWKFIFDEFLKYISYIINSDKAVFLLYKYLLKIML